MDRIVTESVTEHINYEDLDDLMEVPQTTLRIDGEPEASGLETYRRDLAYMQEHEELQSSKGYERKLKDNFYGLIRGYLAERVITPDVLGKMALGAEESRRIPKPKGIKLNFDKHILKTNRVIMTYPEVEISRGLWNHTPVFEFYPCYPKGENRITVHSMLMGDDSDASKILSDCLNFYYHPDANGLDEPKITLSSGKLWFGSIEQLPRLLLDSKKIVRKIDKEELQDLKDLREDFSRAKSDTAREAVKSEYENRMLEISDREVEF